MTDTSLAVVLERIEYLRQDFGEVKRTLNCVVESQAKFEREYLVEHAKLVQKTDAAHNRMDEFEIRRREMQTEIEELWKQIKEIQKALNNLLPAYKIALWIAGIIGSALITLIIGLLTGKIDLVFL